MSTQTIITPDAPPLRVDETGTIRVGNTRMTLDLLVHAFLDGYSAEAMAEMWDVLNLGDIYSALGYYLHHKEEVQAYMQERERQAEEIRTKLEALQDHNGLRAKLLSR